MFFSLSPWPSKFTKSGKQTDCFCPWAKETWRNQGPGWTELSCVCLSTLAVQNIRSPVQQAQTGSHMTTQPEWQPAIERKQASHHSIYTKSYNQNEGFGGEGLFFSSVDLILNSYVLLLFIIIILFWFKYWNPPKVKWVVPMKYNKTHFWKCSCALYSSLFLTVVSKLLPLTLTAHSFAAPCDQYNKTQNCKSDAGQRIHDSNNSTPKTKFRFLYHDCLRVRDKRKRGKKKYPRGIMYLEFNLTSLHLGGT